MALNDATVEYRSLMETLGRAKDCLLGEIPMAHYSPRIEIYAGTVITYEAAF